MFNDSSNEKTIQIDNKDYDFNELPIQVQQLLIIYEEWQGELLSEKTAMAKTEAAIRQIKDEIGQEMAKLNLV